MNVSFSTSDWMIIVQTIYRINCVRSLDEFMHQVLDDIEIQIPYSRGVFNLAHLDKTNLSSSKSIANGINDSDLHAFEEYLASSPFLMGLCLSPYSSVSLGSGTTQYHLKTASPIVKRIIPDSPDHTIVVTLNNQNMLYGYILLYRNEDMQAFSQRDISILDILKNHIALQLHKLYILNRRNIVDHEFLVARLRKKYNLTPRQAQVAVLVFDGVSDNDICSTLFFAPSTLKKHLNSIYTKLGVNCRLDLFKVCFEESQQQTFTTSFPFCSNRG